MIGKILCSHLFLWCRRCFAVDAPFLKGIAFALYIFRQYDRLPIIHILCHSLFSCLGFISQCKCHLIFQTFVTELDDRLAVSFHSCIFRCNSVYGHIFKDNGIFLRIKAVCSLVLTDHQIFQAFQRNRRLCDILAIINMLQLIGSVCILHVIFYTICGIFIFAPPGCIGQIFRAHDRLYLLIPSGKGIPFCCHQRCDDLSAVFQFITLCFSAYFSRLECDGMLLQAIVITKYTASVGIYLKLLLRRCTISCKTLYLRSHIAVCRALKSRLRHQLILSGSYIFSVIFHAVRCVFICCPLSIDADILSRHLIRELISVFQVFLFVPARKLISLFFRISRFFHLCFILGIDHGNIAAAVCMRNDHIAILQVVPVQRNCTLDRSGRKCQRILDPCNDHFAFQFFIFPIRMYTDRIRLWIVCKFIIRHTDIEILTVLLAFRLRTVKSVFINSVFFFSVLQIQIMHGKYVIRKLCIPHMLLQLDIRHTLLLCCKVQNIILSSDRPQRPFLI